jgi:hypothetical protein
MVRAGNAFARMLVGLADIDQHGAGANELGRTLGRNSFQVSHHRCPVKN